MLKIVKTLVAASVASIPFLMIGIVISFFIDSTHESLGTVLFVIGGILIVFFSPGVFSNSSSGALHTPVVVYRLVNTLAGKNRTTQGRKGAVSVFFSSLNLVLAGMILWGVSYFISVTG